MSGFKYFKDLNISGLSVCQGSEFTGLHKVLLFCKYDRILNLCQHVIMEEF